MAETLTESFCERCGTRYEFKAPTRLNPLRKSRGLVSGLKNYIMSQDALGDAVGDAMRSEQDALAAAQLDAFHTSFNFCIDCRQYTCVNCWNDDAGRCRSCAPVAGTDDLMERLQAGLATATLAPTNGAEPHDAEHPVHLGIDAWPTADLDEMRAGLPGATIERAVRVEVYFASDACSAVRLQSTSISSFSGRSVMMERSVLSRRSTNGPVARLSAETASGSRRVSIGSW